MYKILNENLEATSTEQRHDPVQLSRQLESIVLKLKGENFIIGNQVNYVSLLNSQLFQTDYLKLVAELKNVDLNKLENDEQRLAFFINVYNALSIHGIADLYKENKVNTENANLIQTCSNFWSTTAYAIDKYIFSLDDIEHGMLRGNRPHPGTKANIIKADDDERLKFSVKNFDPKIHFALNCGAKGCPPISVYSEVNVRRGLDAAGFSFCNSECEVVDENKVKLSKIFLWYKADFIEQIDGTTEDERLLTFIWNNLNSNAELQEKLKTALKTNFTIEYTDYNWVINKIH